jgi:hypothetical protein
MEKNKQPLSGILILHIYLSVMYTIIRKQGFLKEQSENSLKIVKQSRQFSICSKVKNGFFSNRLPSFTEPEVQIENC